MPDACPMSAFNVVGINLQLRLAVYGRAFGEQQVLIALPSIRFLRVFSHNDAPVENRRRSIIEDALVKLAAVAVRLDMIDHRVVIDMLIIRRDVQTVERALRT